MRYEQQQHCYFTFVTGDTLMPLGPLPTRTVATTVRFAMSMTETLSANEFVT